MFPRLLPGLPVVAAGAALLLLRAAGPGWFEAAIGSAAPFRWTYGVAWLIVGAAAYAGLMRLRPRLESGMGRGLTLLGGAGLAALDAFAGAAVPGVARLDLWMTALLGLALAAMAARLASGRVARRWTGRPAGGERDG